MRRGAVLSVIVLGLLVWTASKFGAASGQQAGSTAGRAAAASEADARALCGTACHRYPPPDVLPRSEWRETIAKMSLFRSGQPVPVGPVGTMSRLVVLPEDMERVLQFYVAQAPEALPPPDPWPAAATSPPIRFERRGLAPERASRAPAVSHVRFMDLDGDARLEVVATEMRYGYVLMGRPWDTASKALDILGDVPHPAHVEMADFDGDGKRDLIVADLGSFPPGDHDKGAVVWLRRRPDGGFGALEIGGFPRVADVQPGDFDGDGRLDLLVGAFGWRKTGFVTLLKNRTTDYTQPSLEAARVDSRTGPVQVPTADLNGDGKRDFVAVIAQEHETVVAFLNDGSGNFTPQTIYTAPHPNWGSSGIEIVDFDGDKDLDVLMTNGDSFDDYIIKPYHGIQWLENTGTFPFVAHQIAPLSGAHRARAVDLDGDGDLDIVAAALLGVTSPGQQIDLPALVWLERVGPDRFTRHTLERGLPQHASLDAADYDADGDIDLAVGSFAATLQMATWVDIWENKTRQPAQHGATRP